VKPSKMKKYDIRHIFGISENSWGKKNSGISWLNSKLATKLASYIFELALINKKFGI
jgi:hypothetical protein